MKGLTSIAVIETITLLIIVLLWGVNPTNNDTWKALKTLFSFICLLGVFLHYFYLLTIPTQKEIYPFFIVERMNYSVVYPDIGQLLILLLITDYAISKRSRRDARGEATINQNSLSTGSEQSDASSNK
jgi:ABC-type transport system involved in multi-copper enzyme maturation permease subunit